MEALQRIQEVPKAAVSAGKFLVEHLTTGAWGVLADHLYSDQTHEAVMGHMENIIKGEN